MSETVELKPWPLGGYAPGNYSCICGACKKEFVGDKRAWQCLECAAVSAKSALTRSDPAVRDRVKPLEWDDQVDANGRWTSKAPDGFGNFYRVVHDDARAGDFYLFRGARFYTDREAKSRAQACHDAALTAALCTSPHEPAHPDDWAVDRFAAAMKGKLAKKRSEGRSGWDDKTDCSAEFLSRLLREHVEKGDPLDVGNLAMMLHQRGERII